MDAIRVEYNACIIRKITTTITTTTTTNNNNNNKKLHDLLSKCGLKFRNFFKGRVGLK